MRSASFAAAAAAARWNVSCGDKVAAAGARTSLTYTYAHREAPHAAKPAFLFHPADSRRGKTSKTVATKNNTVTFYYSIATQYYV